MSVSDATLTDFIRQHRLPDSFDGLARRYYLPLLEWLQQQREHPLVLGINGCQGSGKSTLADFIARALGEQGKSVAVLSIDDFYLTRAERKALADQIHPLLQTRGVPGTHDLGLAMQTLDSLLGQGADKSTKLPRFDKSCDDRAPMSQWPEIRGPVDFIILEGWCVGSRPQADSELETAVNQLEAEEDSGRRWRNFVNDALQNYQQLFSRLHKMLQLKAPDFSCVYHWRLEQEQKLAARSPDCSGVMSAQEIARFIQHYQRLTEANLVTLPSHADVIFELNTEHGIDTAHYS
ncbi:D-glycerate 3-kinase [Litorivivens lipolytica]|uniref:D-glycerate 3-kinase n=1 Tax=Litorivivens lipolytica TaxID=1524264 RepID=A0A7W4W5C0_9GAMM|nr:hypothetical protein [Litorivivens lipolytica]MBB3047640.1 D-glycerate 3-kinase [Litorivivens lipolytica]